MSARDKLDTADLSPGDPVRVEDFNLSSVGSIEYNVDRYFYRTAATTLVNFINTTPTVFDDDYESGYVASDALLISRGTDTATVDIKPGVAYVGGAKYKQIATVEGYTVQRTDSTAGVYYIRLRWRPSTATFDFWCEKSETANSKTAQYLTITSAEWTGSAWLNGGSDFGDERASNTALTAPASIIGDSGASTYILTVRDTNAARLVLDVDGYIRVGTGSTLGKIDVYGNASTGITFHTASYTTPTISCTDNKKLLIDDSLSVANLTAGSMTLTSTQISGVVDLDFGASPDITCSSGNFGWNSHNFTSVGAIGCASVDATGNVQGSQLISDIVTGTAPLTITSTTKVSNLNVDRVDDFHLNQDVQSTASPSFVKATLTQTTGTAPLTISSTTLCTNLNADLWDGYQFTDYLNQAVKTTSSPIFSAITVGTTSSITFDSTGTDPIISAASGGGALYFGDAITLSDKATPDWSITGAGAATFTSVAGGTSVAVTNGPTLSATGIAGASGDNITGFTNLTISGAISAATATNTINGVIINAGTISNATWQGTAIADAYVADDITLTNITQITNRSHTNLSDKGTNTHAQIDTHIGTSNIHYTQANITAVGTIASGTWQGGVIDSAYLDSTFSCTSVDATGNITSGGYFRTTTAPPANPGSGGAYFGYEAVGTQAEITCFGGDGVFVIDCGSTYVTLGAEGASLKVGGSLYMSDNLIMTDSGCSIILGGGGGTLPGSSQLSLYESSDKLYVSDSGGNNIQFYPTSGYVTIDTSESQIRFGTSIFPDANNTHVCGDDDQYWAWIYVNNLRYKTALAFDHIDDIATIKTMVPSKEKDDNGLAKMDTSGLPKEVCNEKGFFHAGNMDMLLAGAIKQMANEMDDLRDTIGVLMDEIEKLKKNGAS